MKRWKQDCLQAAFIHLDVTGEKSEHSIYPVLLFYQTGQTPSISLLILFNFYWSIVVLGASQVTQ